MEENEPSGRDYSTISPSAKSLLLLKAYTNIPFAREAAEQMLLPEKYELDFTNKDFRFWLRLVHFESRYWSIDQLMADLPIKNILEISSGFSFRGLAAVERDGVHYIDTDLPEVISVKQQFIKVLQSGQPNPNSKFELLPLNALDEKAFEAIVGRFPDNEPILIINEGLLMYLGIAEKEKLCKTIFNILEKRGGYWITADIYLKQRINIPGAEIDDKLSKFFEQHHVREQMFDSFEEAETFFNKEGFIIDKEAGPDRDRLTSLPRLLNSASAEQMQHLQNSKKIQATWRMKLS
jgi:O-methyltransferase involved in polyketide biosynthesis